MFPTETGLPVLAAQLFRGRRLLLLPNDIGCLGLLLCRLFMNGFRRSVSHDGFPLGWGCSPAADGSPEAELPYPVIASIANIQGNGV
jgi:hypothetical protein